MESNYLRQGEEYYKLMGEKNIESLKKYLDSNVEFSSPMATLKGKDAAIQATTNFTKAFTSLKIRAKFSMGDQVMIVYNVDIPGIATDFPSAALLNFRDGLIVRIELFFDGSKFLAKK